MATESIWDHIERQIDWRLEEEKGIA